MATSICSQCSPLCGLATVYSFSVQASVPVMLRAGEVTAVLWPTEQLQDYNFCCWVALPFWAQRAAAMLARLGTELLQPLVISSGRLRRSSKIICTPNLEGEALSPRSSGYSGSGEPELFPSSLHKQSTHTHSYAHLPMHTLSHAHTPHTRPVTILQSSLQKHPLVVPLILYIH